METLVSIRKANLYSPNNTQVWKDLSFQLKKNQIHAVVGESGSGKTTLAYSLFGLLPRDWNCTFEAWSVLGSSLLESKEKGKKNGRCKSIFLVPQNPNLAFHPYRTMGSQIKDFFQYGLGESYQETRILSLWKEMGLSGSQNILRKMPNSFSGGEKQRICVSLALLANPQILVLDEPTTGLDAVTEHWVLARIKQMAGDFGRGVLFISHDLRIVESLASEITIMKEGRVVETITVKDRKFEPKSEYGKALEAARKLFA